jgi:hypothetical protein
MKHKPKTTPITDRIMEAMYFIISTSQFKDVTDQKTFARAIQTTEYRVSMFKQRKANPTIRDISAFLNRFPISSEWLWRGTGSMVLRDQNDPVQAVEWLLGEMKRLRTELYRQNKGRRCRSNMAMSVKNSTKSLGLVRNEQFGRLMV